MAKVKKATQDSSAQANGNDTDVAVATDSPSELSLGALGGKTGEIRDMFRGDHSRHHDGLEQILDLIKADPGLRASETATDRDIACGARAADAMNDMIERAIRQTGVASDNDISADDVVALNGWLRGNQGRIDKWTHLHGDDEGGEETGFHLVQNDGANTQRFGENFVNTVADGIYHLGFQIENGRLLNEDGDENATLEDVADWLTYFHVDQSTTRTGLDRIVDNIKTDCGLAENTNAGDINGGAKAADAMNHILVDQIDQTGVMKDTWITVDDIRTLNGAIRAEHLAEWTELHGDDEGGEETGFHLVQNDGGTSQLFGENYINTVADGIYHLGFEIQGDNILNEDGDPNASLSDLSKWLNHFMLNTKLVDGTDGDDRINDGRGNQQVDAGNGNDVVTTGRGKDLIDGGDGDDKIDGGAGNDYLFGGEGCDVFVFGRGSGRDMVADFEDRVDKISLARLTAERFDKVSITQVESDTVISYGGSEIVLAGVNCENITQADFVI
jgi:Ca2+-binding RTX toxin-like protein